MVNYTEQSYQIVSIFDRNGNRRAEVDIRNKEFYRNLEGCVAQNIRKDTSFYVDG